MQPDFQIAWHDSTDFGEWGSRARRPLVQFDGAHKGEWMDSVIGTHPATCAQMIYHVVRCEMCIVTHLWPLSKPEDLSNYYAKSFYQDTKPLYLQEYGEDLEWWRAIHCTVFDVVEKYIARGGCMLDIGAGPGTSLGVARERRYDTSVIEPSPVASNHLRSRGQRVYEGNLSGAHKELRHGAYDLLYAWEVLEHSPEPDEFLMQCHDLLAPGGVIVVAVPNDYAPGQFEACRRFDLSPWWVSAPDHQHYFTPKTLQLALRRCGFKQRYMRMTYPLIEEFMLEQGKCYVGNPELGRQCHRERMQFELEQIKSGNWPALEAQYIDAVQYREGREIIGIFQKES